MSVAKDLTGEKFGEWVVLKRVENDGGRNSRWLCRCSCGNERVVYGTTLIKNKTKSCGCLRSIRKDLTGKVFNKWTVLYRDINKNNKVIWFCRCECGYEKGVIAGDLMNGKSSCCEKCSHKLRSKENHPRWNQNLTDDERVLNRRYPEYIEWRKEVFNRDSYTCQLCGVKGNGTLNAHHIESYTANPELRTALSNGITLCEECHKNFHHQYGYGNNTKAQLNEFSKVCN